MIYCEYFFVLFLVPIFLSVFLLLVSFTGQLNDCSLAVELILLSRI